MSEQPSADADSYAGLADRYDLFFDDWDRPPEAEVAFYRGLFAERGVRRVLDCACGTGHDLALFARLGCEVTGADVSGAMLAGARRNLAERGIDAKLVRADYRELPRHFPGTFDAVTCLASSILHMGDEAELLRALRSMRGVLREGGVLVMTQGTTDRQLAERPRFLLVRDDAAATRLFAVDYLEPRGVRYHIIDVCRAGGEATLRVWSTEYPRVWLRDDYLRNLATAGFRETMTYGGYDGSPYDPATSHRLIVVARA